MYVYGFFYQRWCKHIEELLRRVDKVKLKDYLSKRIRYFPSPLKNLDYLFDGNALTSGAIFGLYGKPQSGKTLFALQTAYYLGVNGYNVLYIDTEGSFLEFANAWLPRFEERYGGLRDDALHVEDKKDLVSLLEYLGYRDVRIIVKSPKNDKDKGGKYEFHHGGMINPSPVEKYIVENKIDFVILDSITAPLRLFPTRQQNFPARSDVIGAMMSALLYLQGKYNIGILTIHHASRNQADVHDVWERMIGGSVLHHFVKRMVNIKPSERREFIDIRKLWLVRGEGERVFGRVAVVKITKNGYVDVPKETWYKYLTDGELRRALNIEAPQKTSKKKRR